MKIVATSYFKNPQRDHAWFYDWCERLSKYTGRTYHKIELATSLGKTLVWKTGSDSGQPMIIFPGFRTSPLFWDLDKGLDFFEKDFCIYLVETNGQPNPSDGNSPAIRSMDYGHWAREILVALKIDHVFIAGASFGGLVCMKLALIAPEKIKAAFLLNPGCLQPFSLKWSNLVSNMRPIFFPSEKNIRKFLDRSVLCKPEHQLTSFAETMLVEFEGVALKEYRDKTQKPYYMDKELDKVTVPTYSLEGDKDFLFPYEKSVANAQKHLAGLKDVTVFKNVAHGIETYRPALRKVSELMNHITQ